VKANPADEDYTLSILIDDDLHYSNENLLEQYYQRPAILQDFGWRVIHVFTKDWMDNPKKVFKAIIKRIVEAPVPFTIEEDTSIVPPPTIGVQVDGEENQPLEKEASPVLPAVQFVFERLVFTDDTSNKFWETAIDENKLIVRFGRIGTKGQTQIKSFATGDVAQKEKEKLKNEKLNKGYKNDKQ
jgi:predicted DNA-binding WGR domain protein